MSEVRRVAKVSDIQGEVRIDTFLTDYSESYVQESSNFVAAVASSNIPVVNESDKYVIYPRGYFWRDEAQVRPLGGRPVQVAYNTDSGNYLAEEWALETTIDDRQRRNMAQTRAINPDENATRLLTQKQMIRADRLWASAFFSTGKWDNEVTGGADFTPWNDAASTPVSVIDDYKETIAQATGFMPNTIVMGSNVMKTLRSHPDIVDRVKYTQRGIASKEVLASLFDVENIAVCRAVYNAANEGATDDINFICDTNSLLLCYIEPNPGLDSPTAIARFSWTGLIPGQTNDMGGVINRGRDDRAWSDWVQSHQAFDMKIISQDLGVFIHLAVDVTSN